MTQVDGGVKNIVFGNSIKLGEVCKCTIRLLYVQGKEIPQMMYSKVNEPQVREEYIVYLKNFHHRDASVLTTGIHVDLNKGKIQILLLASYRMAGWALRLTVLYIYMTLHLQTQIAY